MDDPSGGKAQNDGATTSLLSIRPDLRMEPIGYALNDASGKDRSGARQDAERSKSGRRSINRQSDLVDRSSYQARSYAIKVGLQNAIDKAQKMEDAAGNKDPMHLSLLGFDLAAALQDLWKLRNLKENDWQDLVALLQAAISRVEFEEFSVEQCRAVRVVVEQHLSGGIVDLSDLESSLRLLRSVALDPWKGVSKSAENEHE